MKTKTQTPLGYLMALMEVSLAHLSDYLYVAQTSISKWKTGARRLRTDSPHFDGIVEFFLLLSRKPEKKKLLLRLFSDVYPEETVRAEADLSRCLRAFLSGLALPTAAVQFSLSEQGRLYAAQFSVYSGEDGCKSALSQLMGALAQEPPGAALCALMGPSASSGSGMLSEIRALLARLVPLAESGYRHHLLMDATLARALAPDMAEAVTRDGVSLRLLPENAPVAEGSLTLLAGPGACLVSSAFAGDPRYCALFTDALTLRQHQAFFDNLWAQAEAPYIAARRDEITPEACRTFLEKTLRERMDWMLPSLPHFTMSRELLMEVLEQNEVSGRHWVRMLGCYDCISEAEHQLYIPAQALGALSDTLADLSLPGGGVVRLTPAQARRHLLDTAARLRAGTGLGLLPIQDAMPPAFRRAFPFCRRNAFAGLLGQDGFSLRVTRHPLLVAGAMAAMDRLAEQIAPGLQDPPHMAEMLEKTALRIRSR